MGNIKSSDDQVKVWYLDLGCSNHIIGDKNWFIMLDEPIKKLIIFVDGRHVTSKGKRNIVMVRKDGQKAIISNVIYVSSMTSNLINMGQLLAKGNYMKCKIVISKYMMVKGD